ncbi:MAG: hypothetical protein HEP71_24280 [Roseivirga sp.]|nr:hypothetical protein [Roseivirga sp.]
MKHKITLFIFILFMAGLGLTAQTEADKVDSLQAQKDNKTFKHYQDEPPSYPGGAKAWVKHIRKHLKDIKAPCESGKVFVRFKVLKSGKTDSIQIRRGLCEAADQNAIEIVKKSGLWRPAYLKGQPIDSWTMVQLAIHYK